jgi:GMP synthase (glutamine-hydrolysing)
VCSSDLQYENFVRELHVNKKKFVGICFSHQIIAQALGGTVERSSRDWGVGIKAMKVSGTKPWMNPPLTDCRTLFSHQDQVTRLPEGAELLGGNDHCPFCLYTIGHHFLSIQAHPEYSVDYVRALMDSRREIIPAPVLEAGLASTQQPHHQHELAQWIQNFLKATG